MQATQVPSLDLPAFTWQRLLGAWELDPIILLSSGVVLGAYLFGVTSLARRGDGWSRWRSIAFVAGMWMFLFATSSGLAAYDTALISVHMVQHMVLSMLVPLLLALGAPVTLALRSVSSAWRQRLVGVLHSRLVKALSFPPLALTLYVLSPWALYFSPWYEATLRSTSLHELMHVHLVFVGSLFLWPLVGLDPIPGRVSYPFRMLMILLTLPFHAFLGVTIMGQSAIIAADWYAALRKGPMATWLPSASDDQHLAGGILWGAGDLVGGLLFVVLFVQWVRDSQRESARVDRKLDRIESRGPVAGGSESSFER
jgi:cytochrome c oxidase assembly factor CtaG